MGRLCAVPHCYTGYKRKSTEKISLYKVPDDDFFLTKWQEAIAREDRPITPKDYVCEKHFTEDDIIRKRIRKDVVEEYQRPKLRQDAIPSIFPELPEFILKMTKKRRKLVEGTITANNANSTSMNKINEENDQDIKPNIKIEPEAVNEFERVDTFEADINTDEIEIKEEIDCEPIQESEEIDEMDYSGMSHRGLTEKELQELMNNLDDPSDPEGDPFASSDEDSEFEPSDEDSSSENEVIDGIVESDRDEVADSDNNDTLSVMDVIWKTPQQNFVPKKQIPLKIDGIPLLDLDQSATELDIFLKLFPRSLLIHIADCTNQRLAFIKKKKIIQTDMYEIMLVLGCTLVMSYNRGPNFYNYWSSNESISNAFIKRAISRDRCTLLLSKMYYTNPQKPENCSKTYYLDNLVSCLKKTFQQVRTESSHQLIDETMTKFKGRSCFKQYLSMKPVKSGIKIWQRSDSKSGYTYDFNIYSGKELLQSEATLGERVVNKLTASIRSPDVCICFDQFFTSVNLMQNLPFACVGTYMKSRRNTPVFKNKLMDRGSSEFLVTEGGITAARWLDTKEVLIMSNCHSTTVGTTNRTLKNGSKAELSCPDAIIFYNSYMCGVDLADQKVTTYDLDRKSTKWWRKVFYRLLMIAVVNSWIIYQQLIHKKIPFLTYIVPLAEQMIEKGKENTTVKKRIGPEWTTSSPRQKNMNNVGDHLPVEGYSRRRCRNCSRSKLETRTKTICIACNLPLCKHCFFQFHS